MESSNNILSKCAQYMICGGSASTHKNPYKMGWGIPEHGWRSAVERHSKVIVNTDANILWFHNPFGNWDGHRMQWSQLLRLIRNHEKKGDSGAAKIRNNFLPVMKKLLKGEFTDNKLINVVFYIGDGQTDEILGPLFDTGDMLNYAKEWRRSILPFRKLAAEFPGRVMLGADSCEEITYDHPHHRLLHWLHASEMPVIVEPRPNIDKPHLGNYHMINVWRQDNGGFDRTNPDRFSDARKLSNTHILGMRFALYARSRTQDIEQNKFTVQHIENALNDGAIPLFNMEAMHKHLYEE